MQKIELNKLYVMDCFEFLKAVPDEFADLIIIDPPYNMNKDDWDRFNSSDDFFRFTYSYLDKLVPKLKTTGSFYIFNSPFNCAFILKYLLDKGLIFQNWITWDKRDGLSFAKKKYTNAQETILFFTCSKNYVFNVDDIRIPYESVERIKHAKEKGIIKNGKRWFPNPKGKFSSSQFNG
ncbi:MAG: DNA-methyltransferase [Candidatus Poribacteria bacterium]